MFQKKTAKVGIPLTDEYELDRLAAKIKELFGSKKVSKMVFYSLNVSDDMDTLALLYSIMVKRPSVQYFMSEFDIVSSRMVCDGLQEGRTWN